MKSPLARALGSALNVLVLASIVVRLALARPIGIFDPTSLPRIVQISLAGTTRRPALAPRPFAGTIGTVSIFTVLVVFFVHHSSFRVERSNTRNLRRNDAFPHSSHVHSACDAPMLEVYTAPVDSLLQREP
jgi:hypothetical protein